MPRTIFKEAIRRRAYVVNGRIREHGEPGSARGWRSGETATRTRGGRGGIVLKDARGHEYEKGERVEDRKCTKCRVDARARGLARGLKSGLTRFRGRAV